MDANVTLSVEEEAQFHAQARVQFSFDEEIETTITFSRYKGIQKFNEAGEAIYTLPYYAGEGPESVGYTLINLTEIEVMSIMDDLFQVITLQKIDPTQQSCVIYSLASSNNLRAYYIS